MNCFPFTHCWHYADAKNQAYTKMFPRSCRLEPFEKVRMRRCCRCPKESVVAVSVYDY